MTENANDIVIVSGARTPQGKLLGALASQSAVDLGAHAIKHALQRAGVAPEDVDYVYMGNVVQAGGGQNPAKQAAVAAGLPMTVPAMSLNKVCLSGLVAVTEAARMIRAGEADVVVAGGMESMTNAPHLALGARKGKSYGDMTLADSLSHDGLVDVELQIPMGELTETGNTDRSISREEQDEVAARSHQLAGRAQQNGVFADEIAPIEIPQRKGDPVTVSEDQGVRPDSTAEGLGKLRAAFTKDGTITAGNSSPISDGAAAMVLTTRGYAQEHGLDWLAVVGKPGQVAGPDTSLHSQPSRAIEHALSRAGWTADELDLIEINEAFAAVSVQSVRDLGVDMDKVNIHGGAIALGHPIGASGARLALHTAMELARRGSGKAAVSLCGGGGQGEALLLSR
ncbi:acetyl-CoA C-acetyltransferase [Kocuria sp. BT304]|uniref:acetyl-CoA C-acetyltransferase n=1 Tax=Kocuria sp. BT304 TaxID=1702043 RepID=UPI000DD46611|nr:acetyl-CoA C-acetyltransferase [Kocuria sp. BT304]